MIPKTRGRGRPAGRKYPEDVRVRLTNDLRVRLVSFGEKNERSLSEVIREALELKLALHLQQ